eukprot:SM000058S18584  [mRNA]  locus=s58:636100:638298:- [translate_table: standard]
MVMAATTMSALLGSAPAAVPALGDGTGKAGSSRRSPAPPCARICWSARQAGPPRTPFAGGKCASRSTCQACPGQGGQQAAHRRSVLRRASNESNMEEVISEQDDNYVNATVFDAVEVKSGADGFVIKMTDGRNVRCVHNKPDGGRLPDYAAQPAIVLKMEDESQILLPIIVTELPSTMLMEAIRNVPIARPTVYQVIRDMVEMMGYEVRLARVTHRVCEAYYARLYLGRAGGGGNGDGAASAAISLDLRPSDAINIAVRSKVPIQVNKLLAVGDGVKVIPDPAVSAPRLLRDPTFGHSLTDLDKVSADETCPAAAELVLVRSMMMAAVEERYSDAARLRDELNKMRMLKEDQAKQPAPYPGLIPQA